MTSCCGGGLGAHDRPARRASSGLGPLGFLSAVSRNATEALPAQPHARPHLAFTPPPSASMPSRPSTTPITTLFRLSALLCFPAYAAAQYGYYDGGGTPGRTVAGIVVGESALLCRVLTVVDTPFSDLHRDLVPRIHQPLLPPSETRRPYPAMARQRCTPGHA